MAKAQNPYANKSVQELKEILVEKINAGEHFMDDSCNGRLGGELTTLDAIPDYPYKKDDLINLILLSDIINTLIYVIEDKTKLIVALKDSASTTKDRDTLAELQAEAINANEIFESAAKSASNLVQVLNLSMSKAVEHKEIKAALDIAEELVNIEIPFLEA